MTPVLAIGYDPDTATLYVAAYALLRLLSSSPNRIRGPNRRAQRPDDDVAVGREASL
jgi:hypothetical protein